MDTDTTVIGGVPGWSWQLSGLEPVWVMRVARWVQQRGDRGGLTVRWRVTDELDEPTGPATDRSAARFATPDCLVVGVQQLSWPQWLRRLALWHRQQPRCQLLICSWTLPSIWEALASEVSGGLLIRSPQLMELAIDRVTHALPARSLPHSSLLAALPLPWSEP
jgi:hypothetical protein